MPLRYRVASASAAGSWPSWAGCLVGLAAWLGWLLGWAGCLVGLAAWLGWLLDWAGCLVGLAACLGWLLDWAGCLIGLAAWLGWLLGWAGCLVGLAAWLGWQPSPAKPSRATINQAAQPPPRSGSSPIVQPQLRDTVSIQHAFSVSVIWSGEFRSTDRPANSRA
jgi:hypothetical protein